MNHTLQEDKTYSSSPALEKYIREQVAQGQLLVFLFRSCVTLDKLSTIWATASLSPVRIKVSYFLGMNSIRSNLATKVF